MNKGFNRVGARCNTHFASFAFSWLSGLVLAGLLYSNGQGQGLETIAIPEPRPQLDAQPQVRQKPKVTSFDKPAFVYQSACPALINAQIAAKFLLPIAADGCGERSPLALEAILLPKKVTLSSTPQVNCRVAVAMVDWAAKMNEAAMAAFDSPVARIETGKGYQCRRRNNLPEGKISEHGFANAIDITGFKLTNGDEINIETDWPQDSDNPSINSLFLRTIHKSACKTFTTVLGPNANEIHRDHFHFDLGCHGKNCAYLVCE